MVAIDSSFTDDGLLTPEVGPWAEEKYRHVDFYNRIFSTGMKNKWDCRVYIDLYAGAGRSKIRGTERILQASPLLALDVPDKFDKYIFCEKDIACLEALKKRINLQFPDAYVEYIQGDCNNQVDQICRKIPQPSSGCSVLSFCFVDPFNIDIRFETIKILSRRIIDFLIVLAVGMDATRNEAIYTRPDNPQIDSFLGDNMWREKWKIESSKIHGLSFRHFLAQEYAFRMESLGYLKKPLHKMKEIRSSEKNLPLYHLAFFSRNPKGYRFWDQVLKYGTDQQKFTF